MGVAVEYALVVDYDVLRDKRYRKTSLGRDIADWLAWLELGGTAPRTLDQYERDLARGALLFPSKSLGNLSDGDLFQIAKQFKPGERRVRVAAWRSFLKWARTRTCSARWRTPLPSVCEGCRVPYHYWQAIRCLRTADGLVFCSATCLEQYEDATGRGQEVVSELPFPWNREGARMQRVMPDPLEER